MMSLHDILNMEFGDDEIEVDEDDFGCDYCRNDGRLVEGRCPKCDSEYPEDDE